MEFIRGLQNIQKSHHGSVATIGNFDGVHRGHVAIISHLQTIAQKLTLPTVVITFEPQPKEFFLKDAAPARLTLLREKLQLLEQQNVDKVLCLRFNEKLSKMRADDFIKTVLVDALGVKHLLTGEDFRFGYQREGDFQILLNAGKKWDFQVSHIPNKHQTGVRISSSWIRDALARGNLNLAEELLGRPYSMSGRVIHGDKRGRIIGFPTANLALHRHVSPLRGVFAVRVHGIKGTAISGVANIGYRPTVGGQTRPILEVHLFDFQNSIYGRYIQVDFLYKLRDEVRFESFDLLKQQIFQDAIAARAYFEANK